MTHQHVGPLGTVTCDAIHAETPLDLVPRSPVREPQGLDVERLARALGQGLRKDWFVMDIGHGDLAYIAAAIAAEYARLTPERPADEVDG